jgi:hypothetical protein
VRVPTWLCVFVFVCVRSRAHHRVRVRVRVRVRRRVCGSHRSFGSFLPIPPPSKSCNTVA